jgi:hypothetical protein
MNFLFRKLPIYCADAVVLIFAFVFKVITLNFYLKAEPKGSNRKTMAILGNGPSLKEDIDTLLLNKSEMDFCVVNYFANTGYFKELKPSHYVLIDPVFWKDKINESIKSDNNKLIQNLLEVDWKIELICRDDGYKKIQDLLAPNANIMVRKMQNNWFHFRSNKANIFALRFNLSSPNLVNVLIASIWYALVSGRKNIKIYGADFSSFKELQVDQSTNRVFTSSSHFYQESHNLAAVKEKYIGVPPKTINVRFYQVWLGFTQMYFLSKVSDAWGATIKNKSSFSYLDCFDRD